jgi:hypothetical protein
MKSNKKTKEIAGSGYLFTLTVRVLAKSILFKVFPSDYSPVKTKRNMVSEWMFRTGNIGNPLVQVLDAMLALTMFVLLKPVNRIFGLLFMIFKMVNIGKHGINLLNCFFSPGSGGGNCFLTVSGSEHFRSMHCKSNTGVPLQLVMGYSN